MLSADELKPLIDLHGVKAVRDTIRDLQNAMREARRVADWALEPVGYHARIAKQLRTSAYIPAFNLTGTVIHTNLGRALLSKELWRQIEPLATRPMNLEYDLAAGARGDRDAIVEKRLCRLTGCEAATIVNNNAAALLLCLNTFAQGKKVPVSRGELIEIGGSFRLPELMARSGCELLEVGTTNRTHLKDFQAVAEQSAMLLKVHPSNYFIGGFSTEVEAPDLAKLATQHNIPSCVDLGSGSLVDLTRLGLPLEPTPQSVLADGIDLVTFSGDKLLGGTQAGIIVGKRDLLAHIKSNPLKRALRADKITLAILEATLRLYEDPETVAEHIPLLRTLTASDETLQARAQKICAALAPPWQTEIETSSAQIGSGALPDKTIVSLSVTLRHPDKDPDQIAAELRGLPTPVIARISDERVWMDLRGADPLDALIENLEKLEA